MFRHFWKVSCSVEITVECCSRITDTLRKVMLPQFICDVGKFIIFRCPWMSYTNKTDTANRSRLSIRSRPCKTLPRIKFDHSKFGFAVSHTVWLHVGGPNNLEWGRAWPIETRCYPPCVLPYNISSLVKRSGRRNGSQKSGDAGTYPLRMGTWLTPITWLSPPSTYITMSNSVILGQTVRA